MSCRNKAAACATAVAPATGVPPEAMSAVATAAGDDGYYTDWHNRYMFRKQLSERGDKPFSREEATEVVTEMARFIEAGYWEPARGDVPMVRNLLEQADLSQAPEAGVERIYKGYLWGYANADEGKKLTAALAGNKTAPAAALRSAAEEVAFTEYPRNVVASLANHPNLDVGGQKIMAFSPGRTVREAVAISPRTAEAVLANMVQDADEEVALTSLKNPNSPYRPAVDGGAVQGLTVVDILNVIRRGQRSWQDIPRCGVCGAWTRPDGVCNNKKRCSGFGCQTTQPRRWPPLSQPALGAEVPEPVSYRLRRSYSGRSRYDSLRERWEKGRQNLGRIPQEWRQALADDVSALSISGRVDLPGRQKLTWHERSGMYYLDEVPVPADNAGQAVRIAYAMLAEHPNLYRYSPGHGALVYHDTPEPEVEETPNRRTLDTTGLPALLPARVTGLTEYNRSREAGLYESRDGTANVVLHTAQSKGYKYLKEGDTFKMSGMAMQHILNTVGAATEKDNCRPTLARVWALPPDLTRSTQFRAEKGAWAAADGFRMLVMAHDGDEPIPYEANISPAIGNMIDPNREVTLGEKSGAAFYTPDGYLAETDMEKTNFPDYSVIIPRNPAQYEFKITSPVPAHLLKMREDREGRLMARMGDKGKMELHVQVINEADGTSAWHKIGEYSGGSAYDPLQEGALAAVDLKYLSEMITAQPLSEKDRGTWTLGFNGATWAMRGDHSSGKMVGVVMPRHLDHRY